MKIDPVNHKSQIFSFLKLAGLSAGLLLGASSAFNGCLFTNTEHFFNNRYPQKKPTIEASFKLVSFSSLAYVGLLLVSVSKNSSAHFSSKRNSL